MNRAIMILLLTAAVAFAETPDRRNWKRAWQIAAAKQEWTPAELTDLAVWLDAADASTLWADTAATTPALNGGAVARWNDKSGNGRHAFQTAATGPLYNNGGWLEFNGTRALAVTNGLTQGVTGNCLWEWVFVAKFNGTATLQVPIRDSGSGDSSGVVGYTTSNAGFYRIRNDSSLGLSASIADEFGTNVFINGMVSRQLVGAGNEVEVYRNGTQRLATDVTANAAGSVTYIGVNGSAGGNGLIGNVYEFVQTIPAMSETDRQKVEGYIAHKWGLTANLPADHPYKNAPPYK